MYLYNVFYLRDSLDLFGRRRREIIQDRLMNWGHKVDTNLKSIFKGDEKKWIDKNCSCKIQQEENYDYNTYSNNKNKMNMKNGFFYNDNSAPSQMIVPSVSKNDTPYQDSIMWTDYSPNSSLTYMSNPSKNTTTGIYRNTKTYTSNL